MCAVVWVMTGAKNISVSVDGHASTGSRVYLRTIAAFNIKHMTARPHATLAVGVAAIRELIQETLRSQCADAGAARRALGLAAEALDALWSALEGEAEDGARRASDRADFFDFAPDPCVFTDVNGGVRCANLAAANLLGVSTAELLHRPIAAFLGAQQQALMPGYLRELMARGKEPRAIRWCATVGGADGAVSIEVSVCEAGRRSGRVTGLCWMLRSLGGGPVGAQGAALAAAAPLPDLPALSQTPR